MISALALDRLSVRVIEEEVLLQLRVGAPGNEANPAACSSDKNSTGTANLHQVYDKTSEGSGNDH
ncbi:hypothetical protein MBA17_09200 [Streptosporangium sp. KLBMP 9127]|nr:hypothetical protein [Streptosporangium sp. KLBMP 9127]